MNSHPTQVGPAPTIRSNLPDVRTPCLPTFAFGIRPTLGDAIAIAQERAGGDVIALRFDDQRGALILSVRSMQTKDRRPSLWLVAVDVLDGSVVEIRPATARACRPLH